MKRLIYSVLLISALHYNIQAQDPKDKNIIQIDLENGQINGLTPSSSAEEIKKVMPFFTDEIPENKGIDCDGGIYYAHQDLFFYTARDFVSIRTAYNGQISKDLLTKNIQQVSKLLGQPDHTITPAGDEASIVVAYYKTSYGCLRLNYMLSTGFIFEIGLHAKPINEAMLDLCF